MPEITNCTVCGNIKDTAQIYMPLDVNRSGEAICEACIHLIHFNRHKAPMSVRDDYRRNK